MATWELIGRPTGFLTEMGDGELPGETCAGCGATLWDIRPEVPEPGDRRYAICENCDACYAESEADEDDPDLLSDWTPSEEEDEPDTLAGRSVEDLDAELAALRGHISQRRDDPFPPDAEEEADLLANVARYTAAIDAAICLVAEGLDDNEKTMILILSACVGTLPMLDLTGSWIERGLLLENGTLSPLGQRVAKVIMREDPEIDSMLDRAVDAVETAKEILADGDGGES